MNLGDMMATLSDEEKALIKESRTTSTALMNKTRIQSEMYLAKTLSSVGESMIKANEELSRASNKYSKRLGWFTLALVFVGVMEIVTLISVR